MKKETAWKIFKFFSVLLFVDLALIPMLGLLIDHASSGCDDGAFICIGSFLLLILMIGSTWIVFWWKTYAIAFIDEQWVKKWSEKFPILLPILIAFGRGPRKVESPAFAIRMFLVFCAGIAILFFYQLYHILKFLFA